MLLLFIFNFISITLVVLLVPILFIYIDQFILQMHFVYFFKDIFYSAVMHL